MSNKAMTITDITKTSKQFKDTHTLQVGGFNNGGRKLTAADVQKELRESIAAVLEELRTNNNIILNEIKKDRELLISICNRLDKLEQRFDNLVLKNNLKE